MNYKRVQCLVIIFGLLTLSSITLASEGAVEIKKMEDIKVQHPTIPEEVKEQMKAAGIPTPEELDAIFNKVKSEGNGVVDHTKIEEALKAAGFKVPKAPSKEDLEKAKEALKNNADIGQKIEIDNNFSKDVDGSGEPKNEATSAI